MANDLGIRHDNEYGFETFDTRQLTPTLRLQPDVQVVWNPVFNPTPARPQFSTANSCLAGESTIPSGLKLEA